MLPVPPSPSTPPLAHLPGMQTSFHRKPPLTLLTRSTTCILVPSALGVFRVAASYLFRERFACLTSNLEAPSEYCLFSPLFSLHLAQGPASSKFSVSIVEERKKTKIFKGFIKESKNHLEIKNKPVSMFDSYMIFLILRRMIFKFCLTVFQGFFPTFPGPVGSFPETSHTFISTKSNRALPSSLFHLLQNPRAKYSEDKHNLKISDREYNHIIIKYFDFQCHSKDKLPLVNFVS